MNHYHKYEMPGLHAKVEKSLRSQGVRYTTNRRALIEALENTPGPLTVEELHRETDSRIPFSSIYRDVRVLADSEVLTLHHSADRSNRFELAEWLSGHHHHLVCVPCTAISDISLDPQTELRLARLAEKAAADTGYQVTGHALEIEGLCPDCR